MGASIRDLLGDKIPECLKNIKHEIRIGNVYKTGFTRGDGIYIVDKTKESLSKYFVVIGYDDAGNVYGGLLISSELPSNATDDIKRYQYPVKASENDFLYHDSWINCYKIICAKPDKLNDRTFSGCLDEMSFYYVVKMVLDPGNMVITDAERTKYNIKLPEQPYF